MCSARFRSTSTSALVLDHRLLLNASAIHGCFWLSFRVNDGSSLRLPYVARLFLNDINAGLPRRALVYPLHQHTSDPFKPSPLIAHFIIYASVSRIANLVDLSAVLCSDSVYNFVVLTKYGKLLQQWRIHVWRQRNIPTTPSWKDVSYVYDIWARDAEHRRPLLEGCEANSKQYGVQSPPATAYICDITYDIATNPLLRRRRRYHRTERDITKE
jgi:hypothetical protein